MIDLQVTTGEPPIDLTVSSDGAACSVETGSNHTGVTVDLAAGAAGPPGPEGPQGPQGPQGPTGPAGADGQDGAEGPQGPQGPTGPAGADGAQGAQGPAGPVGADGAAGPQGPAGADGADGQDGAEGPQGPAGPAGADGSDGATGPEGPQGPQGPTGPAGADGADGQDGAEGPQGPAGSDGAEGPAGPTGPAGADGAEGPQGPTGPAGPEGPQGPQGPAGPASSPVMFNASISTGFLTGGQTLTQANIFNAENFSSGSGWSISSSGVTVPSDGIYLCLAHIASTSTGTRAQPVISFGVNGSPTGPESSHAYTRNTSGINENNCALSATLNLTSGQTVNIFSRNEGNISTSRATIPAKSEVSIIKL